MDLAKRVWVFFKSVNRFVPLLAVRGGNAVQSS